MAKSRVVRFGREGGPEVLEIAVVDVPAPQPDEVRIRIEAFGLNRAEAMYRGGFYFERAERFPAIIGYEAAGTIESVGSNVTGLSVGDQVSTLAAFSMRDYGVHAELANVPAHAAVRRPDGQDAVTGAAIWTAGATAYGGLVEVARIRAGDAVLLTAPTGSVGLTAIQIANRLGATSIAVTRNPNKRDALLRAGASHVVIAGRDDLVAKVRDVTDGRGADLIFDAIAGDGLHELAMAGAAHGRLVIYGFFYQPAVAGTFARTPSPLPMSNFTLNMRWFAATEVFRDPDQFRRLHQFVTSGLAAGTLRPVVDRTFDIAEIVEAHRYMESNAHVGKIVVTF